MAARPAGGGAYDRSMLLRASQVLVEDRVLPGGWVRVAGDRIVEVGSGEPPSPPDHEGPWLVPGFVDTHVHGGGGGSFGVDPEDVRRAWRSHLDAGTTTVLASLVSGPVEQMAEGVRVLGEAGLDVHLEGPFLAPGRCGAHDPGFLRAPTRDDLDALLSPAVRMVTLAPELDGGLDAVGRVVAAGAVAAVGHTDADYDLTRAAIAVGASVGTHLFNAMPPLHHREPGPVAALLEDERVTVEVVADGVHVHPAVVRTVLAAAPGRVSLVSDATGGLDVETRDGAAWLRDSGVLAGSTLTLAQAVRNLVAWGVDVTVALTAASRTPARALGLDDVGRIAPGKRADLLVLDGSLHVDAVLRSGTWHRAPA